MRRVVDGRQLTASHAPRRMRASSTRSSGRSTSSTRDCFQPAAVDGELGALYTGYRDELDRLERWDRGLLRSHAVERLRTDLDAWRGEPVFAYGFEDLTGAEWELLEALAARTEVTVSLPYEPGRPAFAALRRTAEDLAALAGTAVEELPPRYAAIAPPALAHLERALFSDEPGDRAAPRRGHPLLRGSRESRHARARRRGGARARTRRHGARADRDRRARIRPRPQRRSRPRSARSASRIRSTASFASRRRRSCTRLRRCCALPGQAVPATTSSASFARRSRGSSAGRSTSSRAGSAGAPSPRRSASSRRRRACAADRCPRSRNCATRPSRSRRCGSSPSRCCGTPTASSAPPADASSRLDLRAYEALRGCSASSRVGPSSAAR